MRYYKVIFNSIPQMQYACNYIKSEFLMKSGDMFEITYLTDLKVTSDKHSVYVNAGLSGDVLMEQSETCRFHTVAIECERDQHEITREQIVLCYQHSFINTSRDYFMAIVPERITDSTAAAEIGAEIKNLIAAYSERETYNNLVCAGMLFKIFGMLTNYCVQSVLVRDESEISYGDALYCRRCISYIASNIDKKISVPEIAAELEISAGHLSRVFKAVTGQTLVSYITKMKVEYVKELLEADKMNIAEAAQAAGFNEPKYLSRIFKQVTGMTPSEYRKADKNS